MSANDQNIAILVFARSSVVEQRYKKIARGGRILFDALTHHTLRSVRETGLPYVHCTEKEQHGYTFGERFNNALKDLFQQGYQRIIAIGNDTPHLNTAHLLNAVQALEKGQNVLGPSTDGGFYLLGLQKADFDHQAFLKLPWQKAQLYDALATQLQQQQGLVLGLETLMDIDTIDAIIPLLENENPLRIPLRKLLRILLQQEGKNNFSTVPVLQDTYTTSSLSARGSPTSSY